MRPKLYFAFGSNLNCGDWTTWCTQRQLPTDLLVYRSLAFLPNHDLAFSRYSAARKGGVLNIVPRVGQIVPGVIFEVAEAGWEALDVKEGVPVCYERVPVVVIDEGAEEVLVETYRIPSLRTWRYVRPHSQYVERVRQGLERFGLPTHAFLETARGNLSPWLAWNVASVADYEDECEAGLCQVPNIFSYEESLTTLDFLEQ